MIDKIMEKLVETDKDIKYNSKNSIKDSENFGETRLTSSRPEKGYLTFYR